MRYIVIFLAGAFGALLANRGIAVFNDAVRPVVPEYREGRMTRLEFATTTFALSFGLVIGFGIPYSIMSPIILVHSLWLGTDVIGIFFPAKNIEKWYLDKESMIGAGLSVLVGGLYGVLLLTGLVLIIVFAVRDKSESTGNLASIFGDRVKNIRKNIIWIAIMGAIYGLACNMHLLMEGPQSLVALKDGNISSAVSISFARALSFIPLKALTSLTTGTFVTDGFGFTATVGLLAPNGVLAAVFGAVVMSLEALSLAVVAKLFDKVPSIKKSADSIRVAMTKLLEVAILVGSMSAAEGMAPGFGFLVVGGFFVMNEYFKKPIVRMAVGPIAVIAVGVLVNVLAVVGLYSV